MNRDSYNRIAASWDRARTAFHGREQDYLDMFLERLPATSSILDLGCGTGRPVAEYILGRGLAVTGVDQSAGMLALARTRFPGACWIESRIEDFHSADRFAGIVCWDALFHIERVHHVELLARWAGMLAPGGRLMITIGGSDHPAFTDTMFGEEFFYDSHPPPTILPVLGRLGFVPLVSEFTNLPTAGRDKGRYAIVAQLPCAE